MPKDKLTDYSATNASNTDVGGVNTDEGMLPSAVNNAIREVMTHLKNFAAGTDGIDVLSLADDTATNAMKIQAPASVTADTTLTLPDGDGAENQTLVTDGSGTLSWADLYYGGQNLIINGDMAIGQRGDVTISASSSGYGGCDRWIGYISAGTATVDLSQDTDVPSGQGFSNSQKMACSATGTFSSSSYSLVGQLIEGKNLQHLKFGTSSAESLTLSFWVKSNKTGTFNVEIRSTDSTLPTANLYQNMNQVTISAADTWEYKTFTIVGNTSGDIRNNFYAGLEIYMWLKSGSDYTSGGDVSGDGWVTYSAGNIGYGADLDITTSTSDYFSITGVKLEVGSTATPFQHESYAENLRKCQRYYIRYPNIDDASATMYYTQGMIYGTTVIYYTLTLPVPMREQPDLIISNATHFQSVDSGTIRNLTNLTLLGDAFIDNKVVSLQGTGAGMTAHRPSILRGDGTAGNYFALYAEL